jgi:hypothetical protein
MEARKVKTRGAGLRRSRQPDPAGRRRQAIGSSVRAAAPTWPKNDISRWNTGSCGFTSTKRSGDYRERRPRPKTKMRRLRHAGPTPGERLKSDFTTRWYQFCICDIVSMLCMSIHGMCMFTEPVLCRGRHGQESEEGKEDREGSHQESGKEDFKEKEVVASTAGSLRLRVATLTQSEISPKDMKRPLQPFGIAAR